MEKPYLNYVRNDIEKFRLVVEQLEVCRELIVSNSHVKSRMAMILIDNLADVLASRSCEAIFEKDSFFAIVQTPRISPAEIKDARRDFDKKISILERFGLVSGADATILRISHQYRNAAFHRDAHNPSIIKTLARACFKTVCNLFVKKDDVVIAYGGMESPLRWLLPYAKDATHLNFQEHSRIIANKLLKGIKISVPKFRDDLLKDVARRLKNIKKIQNEVGYCSPDSAFNQILRVTEFFDKNPQIVYAQNYNDFIRRTVESKQPPSDKIAKEIARLEADMNKNIAKDLSAFKASVSIKVIKETENFHKKVANYKSIDQILLGYQQLDLKLSNFENYLWKIEDEWEKTIQMEIDRERGK